MLDYLKKIIDGFGKTLTKSGFVEIKLSSPQSILISLADENKVVLSNFEKIENDSTVERVRFPLADFASIINILNKNETFDLILEETFWSINGLPIFSLKVEEDEKILESLNKIKVSTSDFNNLVKLLKSEKKFLKKGFTKETENLLISFNRGTVSVFSLTEFRENVFSNNKTDEFSFFLNKTECKIVESGFKKVDDSSIYLYEKKDHILIESSNIKVYLKKKSLNKQLFQTIWEGL